MSRDLNFEGRMGGEEEGLIMRGGESAQSVRPTTYRRRRRTEGVKTKMLSSVARSGEGGREGVGRRVRDVGRPWPRKPRLRLSLSPRPS